MSTRRHLIPLLAAILVIQGLVAALPHPHQHAPMITDGLAQYAESSIDDFHLCLACSVHAPVVEPAAEVGPATGTVFTSTGSVDHGSRGALSTLATASPRGPPSVV